MAFVFRVENQDTMQGLWYRGDGSFDPHIFKLTDGKAKALPMDFDPAFKLDGLDWISACSNTEDLSNWFSPVDLLELEQQGYSLYRFTVGIMRHVNGHVVFARPHVIHQVKYPISILGGGIVQE